MTLESTSSPNAQDVFVFPQSRAQRRLWMMAQAQPDATSYSVPLALRLTGRLDMPALSRSIAALIARHEILRTRYGTAEGQPAQLIYPAADYALVCESIDAAMLDECLAAEAARPFDLQKGPVLHVKLFACAREEHVLSLVLHHIACDGWSLDILVKDLASQYAFETGASVPAPEAPALQYGDYASWEEETGDEAFADVAFWKQRLGALPALDLPWDAGVEDSSESERGATLQRKLATPVDQLLACARQAETTPFVVLLAVFVVLLHRLGGATHLRIGTPVANRQRPEFETMIGFFTNTLVLDIDLSSAPDFAAVLQRCHATVMEAFGHPRAPFDAVVATQQRNSMQAPLFHAMFALQSAPLSELRLADLSVDILPVYPRDAKFDLTCMIEPRVGAWEAVLEYRANRMDQHTAGQWLDGYVGLLGAVLSSPTVPLAQLPMPALPVTQPRARVAVVQDAPAAEKIFVPPQTSTEQALAAVWSVILGSEPGRDDNFFSLGGDSLGAVRSVVEARKKGLRLTPRQVLGGQSLRELAADLDRDGPQQTAGTSLVTAAQPDTAATEILPPTPIIAWFAGLDLPRPDHWSQTIVIALDPVPPAGLLRPALQTLAQRHAALRQRVELDAGKAQVRFASADSKDLFPLLELTVTDDDEARTAVASLAAGLNLRNGPLARAALLHLPGTTVVALALHHVAVDALSWSILLADLESLTQSTDAALLLPPAETEAALSAWHRAMQDAATNADAQPWLALTRDGFPALARRLGAPAGTGNDGDTHVHTRRLDVAQSHRLQRLGTAGLHPRTQAVLLTSLCHALLPAVGGNRVALTVEHHGRDDDGGLDVDTSTLSGWFTALSPFVVSHLADRDPLDTLTDVSRQLAMWAPRRQEYGLARWLGTDADTRDQLHAAGLPEISFNFLGNVARGEQHGLRLREDLIVGERASENPRSFTLDIVVSVLDDQLRMDWRFSPQVLDAQQVEQWAQRWVSSLDTLLGSIEQNRYLAADHPLARLSQAEMHQWPTAMLDAGTFYNLTPLQEGMLFEALAYGQSGAFHEQITAEVDGPIDRERFAAVWQTMLDRHAGLRAAFLPREQGRPVQWIAARALLPVRYLDWTDDVSAQAERLAQWLRDDAAQPFDLAHPPLMRLAIIKLDADRHRWIWSHHHILLDGWSMPLFFGELLALYNASSGANAAGLPAPRPFSDHLAWLAMRASEASLARWAKRLQGIQPCLLAGPPQAVSQVLRIDSVLSAERTVALDRLARTSQATLNTVFNAAWSLLLAASGDGSGDVVFGVTLSGRFGGLRGVDRMLGMFINTLPLRVQLNPDESVVDLLGRLQKSLADLHASEQDRLADISRAAALGTNTLFDTLLVFENYPVEGEFSGAQGVRFGRPDYYEHSNYPIEIAIIPGERITLRLEHDSLRYSSEQAAALVARLLDILNGIAETPTQPLGRYIGPRRVRDPATTLSALLADVDEATLPFGLPAHEEHPQDAVSHEVSPVERDTRQVSDSELALLREQASRLQVSVASICHLAWAVAAGRLASRDDSVFGTVIPSATDAGAQEATIPVRTPLDAQRVDEAVRRMHAQLNAWPSHATASLCDSLAALPSGWCGSQLRYRTSPDDTPHADAAHAHAVPSGIRLDIVETARDLVVTVHAQEETGAARIAGYWLQGMRALVDALAHAPATPLHDLSILSAVERQRVLYGFNHAASLLPSNELDAHAADSTSAGLTHALFEDHVRRAPEALALVHDTARLTYAQLNRRANHLAHRLLTLGVQPDDPVVLFTDRSVDMVVGMLGILKAGGAYVPIDPAYPVERVIQMATDSHPRLVLSTSRHTDAVSALTRTLSDQQTPVVWLDDPSLAAEADTNPDPTASGLHDRHLAYVIYTSGSTGRPKGVMIEHRSVCRQIASLQQRYGLSPQDRVLQFASMTFDMSVEEIFGALLSGATLVLRGDAWLDSAAAFCAQCEAAAITVANLPTVFWQHLAHETDAVLPGSLRQIMIGGEAVSPVALRAWFARPGHRPRLFNAYGPTEATVNASIQEATLDDAASRSIGAPLPNTRLYVLDTYRHPVPVGVVGELYIGGSGVARGYLHRPELNAERFLPDPFAATDDARLYRTGDLVCWRDDGRLDYVGRSDDQLKVRGFRIEPGEIEACLVTCTGVKHAVVTGRRAGAGQTRLIAYYLGEPVPADTLNAHLSARLPAYMVPTAYVHLQAWPLTPNGKLDRRALPDPVTLDGAKNRPPDSDGAETRDPLTDRFAEAFHRVLGMPDVGAHDDYFALGGDSILAMQIGAIMRRQGVTVHPGEILQQRTPANLADLCRQRGDVRQHEAEPAEADVPLLPIQDWFLEQSGGYPARMTLDVRLDLSAGADLPALRAALSALPLRHDALRLRLHATPSGWQQRYAPRDGDLWPLAVVDEPAGDDASVMAHVRSLQAAIDPLAGPVARAAYLRCGPGGQPVLLLVVHHLVVDVASWHTLLDELDALYTAAAAGTALPPPPASTSVRLWADALRDSASARLAELPFWRQMLGTDATAATTDTRRGPVSILGAPGTAADVETVWMHLDVATTRALTGSLNRAFDTRPQALLLAALARAWRDGANGADSAPLRLDLEGHGREWTANGAIDLNDTVGWLTCLYPLSVHDDADRGDWETLVRRVQDQLSAVPDGGLGFGVLSRLAPAGTLPDASPREICWNYLGASTDNTRAVLPGLRAQLNEASLPDARLASDRVSHALDINAMVRGEKLAISFAHCSRTLDVRWTQALANRMEAALRALLAALQARQAERAPVGADALARNELESLMLDITDSE